MAGIRRNLWKAKLTIREGIDRFLKSLSSLVPKSEATYQLHKVLLNSENKVRHKTFFLKISGRGRQLTLYAFLNYLIEFGGCVLAA